MDDTIQKLDAWGIWSRDKCLPAGWIGCCAVIMNFKAGGGIGLPAISDDYIYDINAVMTKMKERKPEHYDVLYKHYVDNKSTRQIAKLLNRSNGWASEMLHSGQAWVDGALSSYVFIA